VPDPYLEALLHGGVPEYGPVKKIDKFDSAIDKEINKYIDSLHLEYSQNNLLSIGAQRTKLLLEIKNAFKFSKLESYLSTSFRILHSKGEQHLDKVEFEQMEKELSQIPEILDRMDLKEELKVNFKTLFNLSDSVMGSILKIAIAEFDHEEYEESLSIFCLLATLDSGNANYWLELGIASQKFHNYELALRSYEVAIGLNPKLIGAKLFSVECYLQINKPEEAKGALKEAKQLAETTEFEPEWLFLLQEISKII
jgi:tetratricopeptide (TPR) repeat protein